jgi:diguanylate cyclase (GGDEF)-like protein
MGNHSDTESIVESVIQVTKHRDREQLEATLATTLFELISANKITFYKIVQSYGEQHLHIFCQVDVSGLVTDHSPHLQDKPNLLLRESEPFLKCFETGMLVSIPGEETRAARYVYPVWGGQEVVGFLEVGCDSCDATDERLVNGFLRIYRNFLSLLEENEYDTLTKLLNRRTFDKNLDKILRDRMDEADEALGPKANRPRRRKPDPDKKHWLAILDLDHFKRINDQYGHIYGDEVLLLLANIMRNSFRNGDQLFRFGGEEFVIVLAPTSFENARNVLERFRQGVESYPFPQVGKVTCSVGFVRIDKQGVPAAVIGHADQALYYAKQNGRNQVCSYETLIEEGKLEGALYSNNDAEFF